MSVLQKIAEIESEMARTQKNKATNFHLGILKAKLAKLKNQLVIYFLKSLISLELFTRIPECLLVYRLREDRRVVVVDLEMVSMCPRREMLVLD